MNVDDIGVVWILVGLGVMVLGPPGAVWADIRRQVRTVTAQIDRDRTDQQTYRTETQEELKSMRSSIIENGQHIAVLLDRIDR